MQDVERIKEALAIEEVVGRYVELKKAGINYSGLCPFHSEKTPSFFVSPERGSYKCFGCGEGGDIFSFVQAMEGMEFLEVLKKFSEELGIPLEQKEYSKQASRDSKDNYYAIMEWARWYWQKELATHSEALDYLKKRGFTKQQIIDYQIGYAPAGWNHLETFLSKKGIDKKIIEKVGLIKKGDQGNYYDRFRERIIFPLRNMSGKVVAVSGRYIGSDDQSAKYLNSPETAIFNKSKELYGIDTAKHAIRKNNFAIIVEGQVDLVMGQSVFPNTLATSGTALSKDHLSLIRRFADRLIFVFDSDEAGIRAAFRASLLALELNFEVKIASLPQGLDPADIIVKDKEEYKRIIRESKDVFEYWVHHIVHTGMKERERNKAIEDTIFPLLAHHGNAIEQDRYLQYVAQKLHLSSDALRMELGKYGTKRSKAQALPANQREERAPTSLIEPGHTPLRRLALITHWQKTLSIPKRMIDIEMDIYAQIDEDTRVSLESALEELSHLEHLEAELFKLEKLYETSIILKNDITELLEHLSTYRFKEHQQSLMQQYRQAKARGDEEKAITFLQQLQQTLTQYGNKTNKKDDHGK
ncbi:MAG: DNA primase [Patescibacteria group bacterium]